MAKQNLRKPLILADLLASAAAWSLFFLYRKIFIETVKFGVAVPFHPDTRFISGLIIIPVFWFLLYYSSGSYTDIRRKQPGKNILSLFSTTLIGVVMIFFALILDDTVISYRTYYLSFFVLFAFQFGLIFLSHSISFFIQNRRFSKKQDSFRIIIAGKNSAVEKFCRENSSWLQKNNFEIAGIIDTEKSTSDINIENSIDKLKAEEVFILDDATGKASLENILLKLYRKDIYIRILPEVYTTVNIPLKITDMFNAPLLLLSKDVLPPWQQHVKTFFDILLPAGAIILLLPLIIVLVIAIKITSPGPVIYSHERIGKNGRPFRILKFRSMFVDSEPEGPMLANRNDERVTKVGRFMRKRRLDEIPNFINVFRGEMSLVGPRPERQFYIEQILERAPQYSKLHLVKPGITSWGQVHFGYAENVDEMIQRMKYDLVYIENMSLFADVQILARTIGIIVKGHGV